MLMRTKSTDQQPHLQNDISSVRSYVSYIIPLVLIEIYFQSKFTLNRSYQADWSGNRPKSLHCNCFITCTSFYCSFLTCKNLLLVSAVISVLMWCYTGSSMRNLDAKIFSWNVFADVVVFGRHIYITLIGRRSNRFAGPRFLKRGCNPKVSETPVFPLPCHHPPPPHPPLSPSSLLMCRLSAWEPKSSSSAGKADVLVI